MRYYTNTQAGTVMLVISAAAFAFGIWSISASGGILSLLILLLAAALAVLFSSMKVSVDSERISLTMGAGIVRKTVPLSQVVSAQTVRNPWYWGWGIRWYPGGWLYNVSGLDAVELELKGGRKLRIGSDEPEKLRSVIRENARI
jgi:hypothetical protein